MKAALFIGSGSTYDQIALLLLPMNVLSVGTAPVELPKGGSFYIGEEVPLIDRARYFDHREHSFNILKRLDYRKICDIVAVIEALFVVTGGTLTESTGLDCIAERLESKPKSLTTLIPPPDSKSTSGQVWAFGKIRRLMRSPILKQMLCNPTNFSFNPRSTIFARVNRRELGAFDQRAIIYFLMMQYKGQFVLPGFGAYAHDMHTALLDEDRLIAGVEDLQDLPDKLRRRVLKIPQKVIAGALHADAVELAKYARTPQGEPLAPGTDGHSTFIKNAMELPPPADPVPLWSPPPIIVREHKAEKRRTFKR